jgi:hypothetical protein
LEEEEVTARKGTGIWASMLYGEREEVNRTDEEGLWVAGTV